MLRREDSAGQQRAVSTAVPNVSAGPNVSVGPNVSAGPLSGAHARGVAPLGSKIVALLGPTNTGKTHHCIERMLEFDTGMLGLPLRLLAREVYDKLSERLGERRVALVTGEEKRVPAAPDYWVCTVEAMPTEIEVDFVGVDEIQLIAHPTRGHVFSERLLRARGRHETWFLGAQTVRGLLSQLVPTAEFRSRPRLSRLNHSGVAKLGRLPPRSAVVAFNAQSVYELAERIRIRRGGAAVVLGALSPRTRNAQVAMYQAGEVDYLVATDAIGMGLNLSLQHVALSALHKFDGRRPRDLSLSELAQIAGRAGRYQNDGSFGTLGTCPPLSPGAARSIEEHLLGSDRHAIWRSADLDFRSAQALLESLGQTPRHAALRTVTDAEDSLALANLSRRAEVAQLARGEESVRLLWEVCQIPDYRRLLPEAHAELLYTIYQQLRGPSGRLGEDWMRERVERLGDTSGDLEALMGRIAFVRTWTYVSQRTEWIERAAHWQAETRQIEDRLSDALHERLVQRFVERTKKWSPDPTPRAHAGATPAGEKPRSNARRGLSEQIMALRGELLANAPRVPTPSERVQEWIDAPHERFRLTSDARVWVDEVSIAKLRRGNSPLHPQLNIELDLPKGAHARLERRLRAYLRDAVDSLVPALGERNEAAPALRGLVYQLREGLGAIRLQHCRSEVDQLTPEQQNQLAQRGVEIGRHYVFSRSSLSPNALAVRSALCRSVYTELANLPPLEAAPGPGSSEDSAPAPAWRQAKALRLPDTLLLKLGFVALADLLVPCDVYEGVMSRMRHGEPDPLELRNLLGCSEQELERILPLLPRSRKRPRARRRKRPSHR